MAFEEIPEVPGSSQYRGFTLERAQWLWSKGAIALMDQVMIYTLVASTETRAYQDNEQVISLLHQAIRRNATELSRIFVTGNTVFQSDNIRMNLGCFEFRINGVWSIYKTAWSDSIGKSQC